jgi:hypothetical protein
MWPDVRYGSGPTVLHAVQWQDIYEPWGWETVALFTNREEATRFADAYREDQASRPGGETVRVRVHELPVFTRAEDVPLDKYGVPRNV